MKKIKKNYVKVMSVIICLILFLSSFETNVLLTSASDTFRWQKKDDNWYYMNCNTGNYHKGWLLDGNTWYYLDKETGIMQSGWLLDGENDKYYLGGANDGAMKTGWQLIEENWYYFHSSGRMLTGWQHINGTWYYLDKETGAMKTGWLSEGNSLYYLQSSGAMLSNAWIKNEDGWYYLSSNGSAMKTGWVYTNSYWYYLDKETGVMKTDWFIDENEDLYYLGGADDGSMKTGWQFIEGNWYYFHASGKMVTGWLLDNNTWYYLDKDTGAMKTGWLSEGNSLYYLQSSGAMLSNAWMENEDSWYYIDASGRAIRTNWVYTNGNWYYLGEDGLVVKNEWVKDNSFWYYFGADGKMHTGWLFWEGNWYYLHSNGQMETRVVNENDKIYVFNSSGAMFANGSYSVRGCHFTADASGSVVACVLSNFPLVLQNPELPTGCEITALTMALNYYGYPVSKITMASDYLPTVKTNYYGVDLDYYFCGDPFSANGIICGAGALVTAANSYLSSCGSSLRGYDISGSSVQDVYAYISGGSPVVAMTTIGMADRRSTSGWYTASGKYVTWSTNDHGSVIIGWDSSSVTVACPIYGIRNYNKAQFEKVFISRGNKGMILQ